MKTATIEIPKKEAKRLQTILNRDSCDPNYPEDRVIIIFTAEFDNGYQADIKVCNSDERFSPFVDPVLFDDEGSEIVIGEVDSLLLGEYLFDYEDETYQVLVKAI
jgi:hypothetical protein